MFTRANDPNPFALFAMFAISCLGTTLTTIVTVKKRMALAGVNHIGAVNSAYTVMLFIGQAIGGKFVVPFLANDFTQASLFIAAFYLLFAATGALILKKIET